MANTDALSHQRAASRPLLQPTLKSHLAYTLLCGLLILLLPVLGLIIWAIAGPRGNVRL